MKINVVGATGQLGRKVARELLNQGIRPIASVRSPDKARGLAEHGVEIRHADYDDPTTMQAAFQGTDVLLLIPSMAMVEPRIQQHFDALQAAKSAGVQRIVFASFLAATPESRFHIAPFLLYAESKLRLSGVDWTILRNGMYLDPIADWIPNLVRMERLPYPVKQGQVAYVCRDDLAGALAAACIGSGHSERLYKLTGPKAVSMTDLAAAISIVAGKAIHFEQVTEKEFAEICGASNEPQEMIDVLNSMYRAVDNGEFEQVTNDIELLTGKRPEAVHEYLSRVWKGGDS